MVGHCNAKSRVLSKSPLQVLPLVGFLLAFPAGVAAETAGPRAVIAQAIDETRLVTLIGNTRPEANRQNDLGPVGNDLHLDMYLQLKRSPEQELAAKQFVESLTDKASPNFHKWITAAEYGQRFGVASEDIATISRWLESHGFTVNGVPANNMVIDFSGTATQVREALHTEIHNLDVAGKRYFANMSDPQIPAALLPAVTGVVSLNNFKPHSMIVPKAQYTVSSYTQAVVPGDLATIYNLNPAFSAGYTGRGQTIVLIEDTDLYNGTGDWSVFRETLGLSQYSSGSLTQVHPAAGTGGACDDPGINDDDSEAALDVEWASAAAPNATIVMASCADTTNFGGFIALQNLLTNGGALPSVVSISYGSSETENGAAENSYINTLYQTAAAAGVSVFVSSGDSAAAASDRGGVAAIYGIGVSGWASTIYNVAVGGTDFGDTAAGTNTTFWNSTNGTYYNSAKSYIPEIPWNYSCGSQVLANYFGYATAYGPAGFCNAYPYYANTVGGSGGPSGCATGARSADYAVSGTCAGYAKPSWQSIVGNPSDGVRDLPDVSLFASNGVWGHYYVVCISDEASCAGPPYTWAGFGGTSISSPIMAGIQALINQALGSKNVGNPNPVYYQIGRNEYSTSGGRTACNSTVGPASTCSFNDVTQGDMVLPCAGAFNCYLDGEALGVLSTSNTSYAPAYAAVSGWDFATGIGTVNAFNLLNAFVDAVSSVPTAVSVTPSSGSGASQSFALQYSDTGGTGNLTWVWAWFNASLSNSANSCVLYYQPSSNQVNLLNDAGTAWTAATPGVASTLQNSQCSLNVAATSVALNGNTLTLNLAMTFQPAFSGAKNIYMYDADVSGSNSGWQRRGSWTVPSGGTPAAVSVTPSSGTGASQSFAFQYSDTNGAGSLSWVWAWFSDSIGSGANSCVLYYQPSTNQVNLLNNAGTAWTAATPGAATTLQNGQCSVNLAATSVALNGNSLTLNLAMTFAGAYVGAQNVYMYAGDEGGSNTGWLERGAWTVPSVPAAVSVTPSSGSGTSQNFALQYSDTFGPGNLTWVWASFSASVGNGSNSCLMYYQPSTNQVNLMNDAGTAWTAATVGAAGTLQNSQCLLNVAATSVALNGNTLTLNLAVTFTAAYAGAQNIYMYAADVAGSNSGWTQRGTWTVQGAAAISVTPSSGSGAGASFAFQYSDTNGTGSLSWVWAWFNTTLGSSANSCVLYYQPSTMEVNLLNDAGTAWTAATPGTGTTLQNSQCSVNLATTSVTPSGDSLTLNLPMTFQPAYAGTQNIYMYAGDVSGSNTGWLQQGTWTVP
jgi:hypothetical protein